MKYGLSDETLNLLILIFRKYSQIDMVKLYGSRAKNSYKNGSDIDLAVYGKKLDLEFLSLLSNDIDNLNLPYTCDFSIYSIINNLSLRDHIDRCGIVIYEAK